MKTADTVGTQTILKAGLLLSGLGGIPVKIETSTRESAGKEKSFIEEFLFFGHQYALATLKSETAYLQALQNAGRRVIRFDLGKDVVGALRKLAEALE